ncbi:hypothetical protein GPN2_13053 [Streptomyces murinus]
MTELWKPCPQDGQDPGSSFGKQSFADTETVPSLWPPSPLKLRLRSERPLA